MSGMMIVDMLFVGGVRSWGVKLVGVDNGIVIIVEVLE